MRLVLECLVPFLLLQKASSWWPFASRSSSPPATLPKDTPTTLPSSVRFELRSAEDKFLAEAQSYLQLPPLDGCLHKVVMRLRKACSAIGEEDLAKFSVQLLNCQSEAEDRQQYTCTEDMTVGECTKDMDSDTWNAYHIISNRARSVCYATRQQQFQMKTELTVNHLANSAAEQIGAMQTLKEGQEVIGKKATDTLHIMTEGQRELLGQQSRLKEKQTEITKAVSINLNRLNHGKNLIATGQQQLVSLTEDIKSRLENTSKQLENQDEDRRHNQNQLLQDITHIRNKAKEVWEKIDDSTDEILRRHNDTLAQYQDMVQNLQRMNETINYLLQLVSELQLTVDKQISWLANQIGGAGDQIGVIIACIQHAGYLLVAMICVVFIHAPLPSRLILLTSVSLNTLAEIKSFPYRMDLRQLTAFQAVMLLLNWLLIWFVKQRASTTRVTPQLQCHDCSVTSSSSLHNQVKEQLPAAATFGGSRVQKDTSRLSSGDSSLSEALDDITPPHVTSRFPSSPSRFHLPLTPGKSSPIYQSVAVITPVRKHNKPSTPTSLSSTPSTPVRCQGVTKSGLQCRLPKRTGSDFCKRHKSTAM